jgi:hypothetical protein
MHKVLTITKKTHLTVALIMIITHLNYRKLRLKHVGFPANFEIISVITNGQHKHYFNESVGIMGPWNVHGQVYLVISGSSTINIGSSSPYPYGLIYGCFMQTGGFHDFFTNPTPSTYIERTFNNVVSGTSFYVSFWITLRSGPSAPPQTFKVYLNSEMVYSGPPTSHVWELMNTTTYITNGTNLTLRFEITRNGFSDDRGLGINGIIIHPNATAQGPTSSSQGSIQPSAKPSSQPSTYLISQNSEGKFLTTI